MRRFCLYVVSSVLAARSRGMSLSRSSAEKLGDGL